MTEALFTLGELELSKRFAHEKGLREGREAALRELAVEGHELYLTVENDEETIWLNCACGHDARIGIRASPFDVLRVAQEHLASVRP